jgi:hypothetical protein
MRGRNNNRNKGPNPLTRSYESNGPDVKIRGTAQHIADKYAQLARDAQASGDPVAAENYLQHAEHYYRIIAAAQEQFREQFGGFQRPGDDEGDEEAAGFGYGPQGDRAQRAPGDDADFGSQPQPYGDGAERPNRFEGRERQDRGDRFEGRERFDRGDRPDRGDQRFDRGDRQDRGDQRFGRDRQERGDRGDPRFDRGERRDRFPRDDRPPRQEFQRQDVQRQDVQRTDAPRQEGGPREDGGQEGPRAEYRQDQPRFPRRPRRDEIDEDRGGNGLPAFLTNPVRTPIAIAGEEPEETAEASAPLVNGEGPEGEVNGRYRQRRRRRPRFEENGETAPDAGSDRGPEGTEPRPAE